MGSTKCCDSTPAPQTWHVLQAFSVSMVRKHARTHADQEFHYGPAVRVVSGNHVTGRRRGIVDGVDFGATGSGGLSVVPTFCFRAMCLGMRCSWSR